VFKYSGGTDDTSALNAYKKILLFLLRKSDHFFCFGKYLYKKRFGVVPKIVHG
jgi:hypothetical protein